MNELEGQKVKIMEKNAYNRIDLSTLSNYSQALSTNVFLDWTICFDEKRISGHVRHTVAVLVDGTKEVAFDTSKLDVTSVSINNNPVSFYYGQSNPSLGRCLRIAIPSKNRVKGSQFEVTIQYSTSPNASAIQWLDAKATSSGKHVILKIYFWCTILIFIQPFIFTQCQAIHARSLFPCQDSPGIKTPYSAVVR
jgi:leukotriene-A4 hydrolase